METFEDKLERGRVAESLIAKWLMQRGSMVLPVYELERQTGKGPRVFMTGKSLVAPDLLAIKDGTATLIEAKHKTVFSWHRLTLQWQTGIDKHHFEQYCKVREESKLQVYIFFYHNCSTPSEKDRRHDGCPATCPTGLYADTVDSLKGIIAHISDKRGKGGMVFWNHCDLTKVAECTQVEDTPE